MKTRSRDVRSTRREVQAMKHINLSGPDIAKALREPFYFFDEDTTEEEAEASLPLPNGTQADPRQAWVLPSNEQEK